MYLQLINNVEFEDFRHSFTPEEEEEIKEMFIDSQTVSYEGFILVVPLKFISDVNIKEGYFITEYNIDKQKQMMSELSISKSFTWSLNFQKILYFDQWISILPINWEYSLEGCIPSNISQGINLSINLQFRWFSTEKFNNLIVRNKISRTGPSLYILSIDFRINRNKHYVNKECS